MNVIPNGVYPTMITPFDKHNEIDYEAVEQMVDWYAKNGCEGIFAVCQSSEMVYLSLEERITLARVVKKRAGPSVCVLASGHISDSLEAQVEELNEMAKTGCDGLVWVTNRLDTQNRGDDVWIKNAEKLLSMMKTDLPLGLYECPSPYKKPLSRKLLQWCKSTGRFVFIKDTCCSPVELQSRLSYLEDSPIKLYNANAQTLLFSLRHGAAGYSGVMANFHPSLFVWLCQNKNHEFADELQQYLSLYAFAESLNYPMTAKYHMNLEGIGMSLHVRKPNVKPWDDYAKFIIDQQYEYEQNMIRKVRALTKTS